MTSSVFLQEELCSCSKIIAAAGVVAAGLSEYEKGQRHHSSSFCSRGRNVYAF